MEVFVTYEIKAALILCAFYVMYRLLLRKETLFRLRRASLLISSASAFLLPLCILKIHKSVYVQDVIVDASGGYAAPMPSSDVAIATTNSFGLYDAFAVIIIAGAVFYLMKTAFQIAQVRGIIRSGNVLCEEDGCRVVVVPGLVSPFSWMRYIVIGDEDSADGSGAVILHEKAHVSRCHTIDVLLMDMMVMMQWFNPVAWVLRDELRAVHEFEADDAVLRHGIDMKYYQYMLVRKAAQASGYSIANNFNRSLISNRISMMAKRRSNPLASFKVLYLVVIASASVAANARVIHDYIVEPKLETETQLLETGDPAIVENAVEETRHASPAKPEVPAPPVIKPDPVILEQEVTADEIQPVEEIRASDLPEMEIKAPVRFADTEQKPTFDGGDLNRFDKWLSENIKVPEEMESGMMLRVAVSFLVHEDGSLSGFTVLGSIGEPYANEAIRAVASSQGMWTPGMIDGEPVSTSVTMPISFKR